MNTENGSGGVIETPPAANFPGLSSVLVLGEHGLAEIDVRRQTSRNGAISALDPDGHARLEA